MASGNYIGQYWIEEILVWQCLCRGLEEASYFLWMIWEFSPLVWILILYRLSHLLKKMGEGLIKYLLFF